MDRSEGGRTVIEDLGFSAWLVSRSPAEQPFQLKLQFSSLVPGVPNLCVLTCPASSPAYAEYARLPVLIEVCELVIRHWDPDDGLVISSELHDSLFSGARFDVGWITYRSSREPLPKLPKEYKCLNIPNRGTLVFATNEPFSSRRKGHVEAVRKLATLIGKPSPKKPSSAKVGGGARRTQESGERVALNLE
jgi:hypothetical protein